MIEPQLIRQTFPLEIRYDLLSMPIPDKFLRILRQFALGL